MEAIEIPTKRNKIKILTENFVISESFSLKEYVIEQSENDPSFFRWLFGEKASDWNDFDLPKENQENWENFLEENFD